MPSLRIVNPARAAQIIARIDGYTGIDEEGRVTLGSGADFENDLAILTGVVSYHPEVPSAQRVSIMRAAVLDSKRAQRLTLDAAGREAEAGQTAYLRRPVQPFTLLTSISARLPRTQRVSYDGCSITFADRRPVGFGLPDGGSLSVVDNTPSGFTYVKVGVKARDPMGAVERGFDAWDTVRGMWNLYFNRLTISRSSIGAVAYRPVNKIVAGPFHTIHGRTGGSALAGKWWFTPYAENAQKPALRVPQYHGMKNFERQVRNLLHRNPHAPKLKSALARYCRALDEGDATTAFLQLWSVLELLTNPDKGSNESLIKRVSFVFQEHEYARASLEYLRDQRNAVVHKGIPIDNSERLLYQLKEHTDVFLQFTVARVSSFETWDEYHSFLDLPPDATLLSRRLEILKRAVRLREI